MNIAKTSFLSGIAVLIRIATNLLINKFLAIYVGVSGYALIGQFQSLASVVTAFGSGAINNGVVKYTAEYTTDDSKRSAIWGAALIMSIIGSLLCALVLAIFRSPLSVFLLGSEEYSEVILLLGLFLLLFVLNGLMLSVLNGLKAVPQLISANIGGSVLSGVISIYLVSNFGIWGALVALSTSQGVAFFLTLFIFIRTVKIDWRKLFFKPDGRSFKLLSAFAFMSATTAIVGPAGQVLIRDQLVLIMDLQGAGLWQALFKISETHLLLLTSTLTVYFLPRLAEISDGNELITEIKNTYRFVIPLVLASSVALYVLRNPLIEIMLSQEFLAITAVMGLYLIGDSIKIASWVMSFTMVSHARTKAFIITEIVFTGLYVASSIVFAKSWGLKGTAMAYVLTYLIYWIVMFWLVIDLKTKLNKQVTNHG